MTCYRQFENQYQSEQRRCLGLIGLAAFTTDQRKKEIGIRKVLGASVNNLMILQLSGYTKMLLVAIILSMPVAYYITKLWLDGYLSNRFYRPDVYITWVDCYGSCLDDREHNLLWCIQEKSG